MELKTTEKQYIIYLSEIFKGKLIKGEKTISEPTDIYVALYNDGTMVFSNNRDDIDSTKVKTSIVQVNYDEWGMLNYHNWDVSGFSQGEVAKVIILNKIVPTNCSYWFAYCYDLTEIVNIENIDTSLVTDMSYMFSTCEKLVADVSGFDTSNVTNLKHMFSNDMTDDFYGASHVTGWQNFDMSNVTDMSSIFGDGGAGGNMDLVLDFCIKAKKIPNENKTLKYIGLKSYESTLCESSTKYQTFLDAGWTTGY